MTCQGTNKSGKPCGRPAMPGQRLCVAHVAITPPPPTLPQWQPRPGVVQRELARHGATAAAQRYVTLRAIRVSASDAYLVAAVDGRGLVTDWRATTLTPDSAQARIAAERLYERMTREN